MPASDMRDLVERALADLRSGERVTPVLEQCVRIATLRRDYVNLWWLRRESLGLDGQRARDQLTLEMKQHFAPELHEALRIQVREDLIERHTIERVDVGTGQTEKGVTAYSLADIEDQIEALESMVREAVPPQGLAPLDLYEETRLYEKTRLATRETIREFKRVRARVRERLNRFLVETEAALAFEQSAASTFERTRRFVDGQLGSIAPDALAQLQAAYERSESGHSEALSHALTSCRRVLKSLADVLYPATGQTIRGPDSVDRAMTDDKYRNRLWQYVSERKVGSSSRQLIQATVEEVGNRIDLLDSLASKGVHANVSFAEVDQCVLQTYLLAGDLLRLRGEERGESAG